jgi:hypothetical protein
MLNKRKCFGVIHTPKHFCRAGKLKASKKFNAISIIENHFLEYFRKPPKSYVDKIRKSPENSMFSRL